ncbi:TetR family transcriptional regulator [Mycolicibacterium fortuitum subsp. acetamidolyticum]|uniref:TetR family transcriptional regulator n=1 Tax=Mycolicibacterium fortuitum subsp. acetamidolyticum TaxID=144550 RepID=A0A100WQF6_MYCFO|nr:TetR/AcrR family transcriptional regulator [Mycolicibacterium fortuitum]MCV7142074.1 TetR/AcrR family transcriptional regulator [Mycolicibacterium fortuitum]GAT02683.1 TetR family transcriptional regulator [Mycolicibacterium fortuitum subsp. acetamidolyticum]
MSRPVETAARGAGEFVRPTGARSDRIHQAILVATAELLDEGGFPAATMDAIAARSGASKATLYKHWPSRTAVAAEAFGTMMAEALPLPDTGSTATDLTEQMVRVSAFYASARGEVFAQLLAACVEDTTGAAYFREYFLSGRRAAITELWRRGVDRGEADAGTAIDDVIDILFGPLIFRRMTGHYPLTEEHARQLAATALRGLLPDAPS